MSEGSAGVFTTDLSLVIRSWDAWMVEATGLTADAACGISLLELYPGLEQNGLGNTLRRVAEEGTTAVLAPAFHGYLIPCPTARPSTYFQNMQQRVTLTPLRSGENVAGVVVQIEDVTERRDEERRFGERLKSQDEAVRLLAVEEVAMGSRRADLLSGAFADPSWRVRRSAADAAAADESDAAADLLIDLLLQQHRDLSVLNSAITAVTRSRADVLPRLIPLLHEADEDIRTYAALVLGLLGNPAAVPALLALLQDASANVRFHALEALGRLGDRSAVDALLEVADSRDFFLSSAALEALAAIGDEGVTPRLLPFLEDELLAPAALDAVARLGGEEAVGPLVALIGGPLVRVEEVTSALVAIAARTNARGGHDAIPGLVRVRLHEDAVARILASYPSASGAARESIVQVAGWLDGPAVDELLIAALEEPETRSTAVAGLVRRGGRAVEVVAGVLERLEVNACAAAVVALGRIGSAAAVPALVSLIEKRPELAVTAAVALGTIGDRRALQPLLDLLDEPSPALRQAAIGALNSIGHPEMPSRIAPLVDSPSSRLRESAARITCYFGYPGAFEAVLSLSRDAEESVRRAAVEHLISFEDSRVGERLREVLENEPPGVRAAAARAVALLDDSVAVPLALRALADEDLWVRYHAARSASSLQDEEVRSRLRELASSDPVVPVRIAAVAALGSLGDRASEPLLVELSGLLAEPELAREALQALVRIHTPEAESYLIGILRRGAPEARRLVLESISSRPSPGLVSTALDVAAATPDLDIFRAAIAAAARGDLEGEELARICGLATLSAKHRAICVEELAGIVEGELSRFAAVSSSADVQLRSVAIEVLAQSSSPAVIPLLAQGLSDPAPEVRRLAELALQRYDLRQLLDSSAGSHAPTPTLPPRVES